MVKPIALRHSWLAVLYIVYAITVVHGRDKSALLITDVQNCFVAGGTLPVPTGEEVAVVINQIRKDFDPLFELVVLTLDWHCVDHVSFASQHDGYSDYQTKILNYDSEGSLCWDANTTSRYAVNCTGETTPLEQTLWPDHCIINTTDASLLSDLTSKDDDIIVKKGYNCQVDSYSAFYDNGGYMQTELQAILSEAGITAVYITGLATDYCIYYTAMDAKTLGYTTYMILDATRYIANDTSVAAVKDMKQRGINVIQSSEVGGILVSGCNVSHIGLLYVALCMIGVHGLLWAVY